MIVEKLLDTDTAGCYSESRRGIENLYSNARVCTCLDVNPRSSHSSSTQHAYLIKAERFETQARVEKAIAAWTQIQILAKCSPFAAALLFRDDGCRRDAAWRNTLLPQLCCTSSEVYLFLMIEALSSLYFYLYFYLYDPKHCIGEREKETKSCTHRITHTRYVHIHVPLIQASFSHLTSSVHSLRLTPNMHTPSKY